MNIYLSIENFLRGKEKSCCFVCLIGVLLKAPLCFVLANSSMDSCLRVRNCESFVSKGSIT